MATSIIKQLDKIESMISFKNLVEPRPISYEQKMSMSMVRRNQIDRAALYVVGRGTYLAYQRNLQRGGYDPRDELDAVRQAAADLVSGKVRLAPGRLKHWSSKVVAIQIPMFMDFGGRGISEEIKLVDVVLMFPPDIFPRLVRMEAVLSGIATEEYNKHVRAARGDHHQVDIRYPVLVMWLMEEIVYAYLSRRTSWEAYPSSIDMVLSQIGFSVALVNADDGDYNPDVVTYRQDSRGNEIRIQVGDVSMVVDYDMVNRDRIEDIHMSMTTDNHIYAIAETRFSKAHLTRQEIGSIRRRGRGEMPIGEMKALDDLTWRLPFLSDNPKMHWWKADVGIMGHPLEKRSTGKRSSENEYVSLDISTDLFSVFER